MQDVYRDLYFGKYPPSTGGGEYQLMLFGRKNMRSGREKEKGEGERKRKKGEAKEKMGNKRVKSMQNREELRQK